MTSGGDDGLGGWIEWKMGLVAGSNGRWAWWLDRMEDGLGGWIEWKMGLVAGSNGRWG